MRRLLAALFLICIACLGRAESTDRYLVDVIVFENKTLLADAAEQSLVPAVLPPSAHSIPLELGDYTTQPNYHNLPLSQSALQNTYYALSRNQNYHVLARFTWRQPMGSRREIDLPTIGNNQWDISGRIKITPSRFPFFSTNLLLSNGRKTIALRHNQPLKLKETYYFDHPVVGMVVRLTPIKDASSKSA